MQSNYEVKLNNIPVGPLGLIPHKSSAQLGKDVDSYLSSWRKARMDEGVIPDAFAEYQKDSYIIKASTPRFGSGEAKAVIHESVRGDDIFILLDVINYSLTYSLSGAMNHMSPDDYFQDLKRLIAAVSGKARRITVIMPYLYESRQDMRCGRESLDCALALQELARMGVENFITFDAHEPKVQNAIPLKSFENVSCIYQFIKALLRTETNLTIDKDHMTVISPDEGGTARAIHCANYLGVDMGMFYKRRDYTRIVDGKNPIVSHEYLGTDLENQDVIIIDDMISSGDSILDVARELKRRKARKVFAVATFGLFTAGLAKFDEAYEKGVIDRVLTTNLIYQTPDLLSRPYYVSVDLSKYIALLIDHLNHNVSIHDLLSPTARINKLLEEYKQNQ